jgi:hypothetical protein
LQGLADRVVDLTLGEKSSVRMMEILAVLLETGPRARCPPTGGAIPGR